MSNISLGAHSNINPLPTDSSSSIIDRTAALYLVEEGKKAFNEGRTRDALRRFREAYVRDKYSYRAAYWIGEAHYNLDNYGYALKYAKIAESLSEATDGDVFYLIGKAYHRQNYLDSARWNYELAEIQLSTAKKNAYNLKQNLDEIDYAIKHKDAENKFDRILLNDNVNSGYDDYSTVLSDDGKELFYVSRRPDTKGGNLNPGDQRYFEDIYLSKWDDEIGDWGTPSNDLKRLNSEGFDAISHLSPDGNTAYLTVNTSILDVKKKTRSSDICVSERTKEDRWSTPRPIKNKSINTSFFDGAPTLTADGNTMYFVSDRDGKKSKSDIYVVYKDGRSWGEAKKLPMTVNTTGNETTPFITPDNRYLFFSSDSRKGFGGYDVYVTENIGDTWTDPVNLGPNFNTVNNDIFFKYYPKFKQAMISTYRLQGNKASMDVFKILIDGWEIP
ncbi:PD40 domain-containing protein [Brumimicrobium salinarum]|nr:PD40 domain-containing protein [Brumimicrobium salinarum]